MQRTGVCCTLSVCFSPHAVCSWYNCMCCTLSVSLHMQSVSDAAATQEPPSCELILSVLAYSVHTSDRTHSTSACLHDECVTAAHHLAMWCTGVCCLVVATTLLLLDALVTNTFPFTLQPLIERASSLPLSHQQSGQSRLVLCTNEKHYYAMYTGVCCPLLFLSTWSLWLMQLLPSISLLPVSWSLHVTPMCIVHAPCTCKVVFAHSVPTLYYSSEYVHFCLLFSPKRQVLFLSAINKAVKAGESYACMVRITEEHYYLYAMYCYVASTLLFPIACSLWLMQLRPKNLLPVSWSCKYWWYLHSVHTSDCTYVRPVPRGGRTRSQSCTIFPAINCISDIPLIYVCSNAVLIDSSNSSYGSVDMWHCSRFYPLSFESGWGHTLQLHS